MEQLKKKLKTDEDLAWVDHSKTLDEQEIHEQDVVLLRRRFFYSDQNVDSRDPIQLGLLFVQTRNAILSGTHPVTLDGACKFAGIQAQAQLGDYVEGKTSRPGYLNLKDYLPADYAKVKQVERKIFSEHKKYYGLNELEAKAKYVGEARSLPTYGVTFFLVKEKVPGKNKLVPRLLGITKDCVMRVDADTKGILKTWPLTTVKRWAASMNSFTLDFGDYSDSYYSVQTTEGEQISQLIAGYIDIILKRRKAKDHFGIEGDEGATMIEDSVAPSRATIIQNQPALNRPPSAAPSQVDLSSIPGPAVQKLLHEEGPIVEPPEYRPAMEVRGKAEIGYEDRPATKYVTNYELTLPQRDLQDRLYQAQDAVEEAQKVLDRQTNTGELEKNRSYQVREVEQKKQRLSDQFAGINAATAQLVSLTAIPEEELNYPALNNAVETVAGSLPTVAKDVRIVAALMEDEESGERLIDATRKLCETFTDLLNAAEPGPTVPRQTLISAASRVGDATQAMLYTINNGNEEEEERRRADNLLSSAKSVARSAAALVLKAKDVASTCRDEELENRVITSATQCALATSQMVATAKIVAPTIYDRECKEKLTNSCREVQRAVEGIQSACNEHPSSDLNEAARCVTRALEELMKHLETSHTVTVRDHYASTTSGIAGGHETTFSDIVINQQQHQQQYQHQHQQQQPREREHQQNNQTTSHSANVRPKQSNSSNINVHIHESNISTSNTKQSNYESTSSNTVHTHESISSNTVNMEHETTISGIVGDLETTIMFATAGTLRAQDEFDNYLYHRENILSCAKALVEDARGLVASASSDQQQLAQAAQESVITMGRLAETVKSSAASLGPNNADSQVSLIRSVKDVAVSLSDLIGSTKSALNCDPNDQRHIYVKDSAKTMVGSVTSLLKTVKSVEDEQQRGTRAIEAALDAIEQDLANYGTQCSHEDPKQTPRCSAEELVRASRPLTMATAKTVHAASSGIQDDAIVAANMGRKAVADLLQATRSASFGTESYEIRSRLQGAGRSCAMHYKHLMELLHRIFQHPSVASANPEVKQELIAQSKSIAGCVSELASCSELLKGSDWIDPDDPTVIAESELLGAASSIDAAAKKLENLKPRVTSVKVS